MACNIINILLVLLFTITAARAYGQSCLMNYKTLESLEDFDLTCGNETNNIWEIVEIEEGLTNPRKGLTVNQEGTKACMLSLNNITLSQWTRVEASFWSKSTLNSSVDFEINVINSKNGNKHEWNIGKDVSNQELPGSWSYPNTNFVLTPGPFQLQVILNKRDNFNLVIDYILVCFTDGTVEECHVNPGQNQTSIYGRPGQPEKCPGQTFRLV